jgi:hypothetical protein
MQSEPFVAVWPRQMLVLSRFNLYRARENRAMDLKHITYLAFRVQKSE